MGILTKKFKDNMFIDEFCKAQAAGDLNKLSKMNVALQAFIAMPKTELKKVKKKIQSVGVSTDFEILTKDSFNVTLASDNFDMGWEAAFKQVSLGTNQDAWEIYNVTDSLTFKKMDEGERLEQGGMAGTKSLAYVDYYGGALGWTDKMIRYRKVAAMVDIAEVFRNNFWKHKGDIHYALLAAAAALNVTTYQGAAADGQLRRDILTINSATFTMTDGLKDKGYGDMANAPILMYANPYDEDRLEAAFRALTSTIGANTSTTQLGGIGQQVTRRPIKRIYTYNTSISAGTPIIVLPGRKIQKADDMAPTVYNMTVDPLTLNRGQAVWAIYGAIVADTEQCRAVTLG